MIHIAYTCIDVRFGIDLKKVRQDELSSSKVYEPVSDDGDAFILDIHFEKFYCFPLKIQYSFVMKEQEEKKSEQNPPSPLSQGGKKKIAILHDAFLYRG